MLKEGFVNSSIKLYEDYNAWLENRFVELGATFITMTIRDGLDGINEGLIQFHDTTNLHVNLTGNELVQISVSNTLDEEVKTRVYSISHSSVAVDQKSDNIIVFNIKPFHIVQNLKFSRVFYPNAKDTIEEMVDVMYSECPKIKPTVNGLDAYIPRVPWVKQYKDFVDFVKTHGLSTQNESFMFIWEDFKGINLTDYSAMTSLEPMVFAVGEPRTIGQYAGHLETPLAYDVEWLTKSNAAERNPYSNCTFYSHSFLDKDTTRLITGEGHNSVFLTRSGGYADMMYRNGYEEYLRMTTLAQYDGYLKFTTFGNFDIRPGMKLMLIDIKDQFKSYFYVDVVVHEMSMQTSRTHVYAFSNTMKMDIPSEMKLKVELENPDMDLEPSTCDINVPVSGTVDYTVMLSDNFSLGDLTVNTVAGSHKLVSQNRMNQNQIACNLQNLAKRVLEPLKKKYPSMIVTSGFRAGANSQHNKGEAVDIQFPGTPNKDYYHIARWIQENLEYDQLLLEYKNTGTKLPWIHISLTRSDTQRKQALTLFNHKTAHTGLVQMG